MVSNRIFSIDNNGDVQYMASYSQPAKQAMINYIRQFLYNDYNCWDYPDWIEGMQKTTYGYMYTRDDKVYWVKEENGR